MFKELGMINGEKFTQGKNYLLKHAILCIQEL